MAIELKRTETVVSTVKLADLVETVYGQVGELKSVSVAVLSGSEGVSLKGDETVTITWSRETTQSVNKVAMRIGHGTP